MKERYKKLKKKFSRLPKYAFLNKEFEISTIDVDEFPLRQISKKISDKLDELKDLLRAIADPDTSSFLTMYEQSFFSKENKEIAFSVLRKLNYLQRSLQVAKFSLDNKRLVKQISRTSEEWVKLRKKSVPLLERLRDCWLEKPKAKIFLEYLV